MKRRETPLPEHVGDRITAALPNGETVVLKVPSIFHRQAIAKSYNKAMRKIKSGDLDEAESAVNIGTNAAMLGYAWADPMWEIESAAPKSHSEWEYEWGLRLLDEWQDWGLPSGHVMALSLKVTEYIAKLMGIPEKEVTEKADFFSVTLPASTVGATSSSGFESPGTPS